MHIITDNIKLFNIRHPDKELFDLRWSVWWLATSCSSMAVIVSMSSATPQTVATGPILIPACWSSFWCGDAGLTLRASPHRRLDNSYHGKPICNVNWVRPRFRSITTGSVDAHSERTSILDILLFFVGTTSWLSLETRKHIHSQTGNECTNIILLTCQVNIVLTKHCLGDWLLGSPDARADGIRSELPETNIGNIASSLFLSTNWNNVTVSSITGRSTIAITTSRQWGALTDRSAFSMSPIANVPLL